MPETIVIPYTPGNIASWYFPQDEPLDGELRVALRRELEDLVRLRLQQGTFHPAVPAKVAESFIPGNFPNRTTAALSLNEDIEKLLNQPEFHLRWTLG